MSQTGLCTWRETKILWSSTLCFARFTICLSSARQGAYVCFTACCSMSWVTARASELDWFELSLHVCRWRATGHGHQWESGPGKADSDRLDNRTIVIVTTSVLTHTFSSLSLWSLGIRCCQTTLSCVWRQTSKIINLQGENMCKAKMWWPNIVYAQSIKMKHTHAHQCEDARLGGGWWDIFPPANRLSLKLKHGAGWLKLRRAYRLRQFGY